MQAISLIFSILTSSFIIFTQTFAQLPYEANESGNGNVRNPLNVHDAPFVPEEFRSSQKRIIFDKNDFVSLLPSSDSKPLKEAILNLLVSIQSNANDTKVSQTMLIYIKYLFKEKAFILFFLFSYISPVKGGNRIKIEIL